MPTQMSAHCFAQVSCSSRLFMRPIVRRAGALARMPSGPGVDQLAAALAASEASGDLRHVHVFGHGVDAHVGLVVAGFACGDDGADAVGAHVGERHWRAGLAAHDSSRKADC